MKSIMKALWFMSCLGIAACGTGQGRTPIHVSETEAPVVQANLELLAEAEKLSKQRRFAEAIPLGQRALDSFEKTFSPNHPLVGIALMTVGALYAGDRRFIEAESHIKRALPILENEFGPDHKVVMVSRALLGITYVAMKKFAEGESILRGIHLGSLNPDDPAISVLLLAQASSAFFERRLGEAKILAEKSIAVITKAHGPGSLDEIDLLVFYSMLYFINDDIAGAEELISRALRIAEKKSPAMLPKILVMEAMLHGAKGRYTLAKAAADQANVIIEKGSLSSDPELPSLKSTIILISELSAMEDIASAASAGLIPNKDDPRRVDALNRGQKSLERDMDMLAITQFGGFRLGSAITTMIMSPYETLANVFPELRPQIAKATFSAAQLAYTTTADRDLTGVMARFATTDDAVGRLVRHRQEADTRLRSVQQELTRASTESSQRRNAVAEEGLRRNLTAANHELTELDARLTRDFPRFAEIFKPGFVTLPDTQKLLAPDEALVVYLLGGVNSFLWVVRSDRADFVRLVMTREQVATAVGKLRDGITVDKEGRVKPFPVRDAHALYEGIFAPAEPFLGGAHEVLVVPHGSLESLPLSLLLSAPSLPPATAADYRALPWLARKYALTTLPGVSSLRALRLFTSAESRAPLAFVGFGDPAIGEGHSVQEARARGVRVSDLFRSSGPIDMAMLRQLPGLPETAEEIRETAKALGANSDQVYLRERFTKPVIRNLPLEQYRVVSFATHAAVSGQIAGVEEPALVLTPPRQATKEDDGLLRASEVAQLKLNADLVVLSACNTAAGGSLGAEGLSGLARAFFYAGSRSLLVSHWPTESESAKRLTTGTFKAMAANPTLGRAGALRASMLELMDDPQFAHPLFWAPFVLVGEGRVGR